MSEESNGSLCRCLRIREWQTFYCAPSVISDLSKGAEDIVEIEMSVARSMPVGISEMDVSDKFAIPYQRLADVVILDIHMEYIRHHREVGSVNLAYKLSSLIRAVDVIDLIAVDWLKYHCDPLLLSIVTERIGHIKEKLLSFVLITCSD